MATCKDCLHHGVCDRCGITVAFSVENDCSSFKDRSKYVVRENGEWKRRGRNLGECSNCGEVVAVRYNFCPNCGADMRIEEQNIIREGENDVG